MANDKEQEIRLQFLEEAQEYISIMEAELLGLSSGFVQSEYLDRILRAAHSIKGGAAMMGYQTLSYLSHRLEDCFKVLKTSHSELLNQELEQLLLLSLDHLRQIIHRYHLHQSLDEEWLEREIYPLFDQLHDRLGDPKLEDELTVLSSEVDDDMIVLLFETEVEGILTKLETVLATEDFKSIQAEFISHSYELAGLGQMLDLQAFTSLCNSILSTLQQYPENLINLASLALKTLRRSQLLIVSNQAEQIPTALQLDQPYLALENEKLSLDLDPVLENQPLLEAEDFNFLEELEIKELSPVISEQLLESEAQEFTKIATKAPEINPNTVRVPLDKLEQLNDQFGELNIQRNGLETQLKTIRKIVDSLKQKLKILEQNNTELRELYDRPNRTLKTINSLVGVNLIQETPSFYRQNFDLLELDRYSDLQLLSGEVMETIVQIQELTTDLDIHLSDTEQTSRSLTRTTKQMQTHLTQVRMRPLSDLVARFPRSLREMSLESGKKVDFRVKGDSTLIERSILEALNDPLLHLIRNAFAHGIEDPETRINQGKPEQGLIEISASYRGNQTVIKIKDDGAGINFEKIKQKLLLMGFNHLEVQEMTENELLEFIFEPGFTTTDTVTSLSGRGVGMDVVRTNLKQIQGDIRVESKPLQGTTFTLTVPLTLSVVRVLLIEAGGMLLAFPSNTVKEMIQLEGEKVITREDQKLCLWEDQEIPLINLDLCFKFPSKMPNFVPIETILTENDPLISEPTLLIFGQESQTFAIQSDRFWGEQEVTVRPVEGSRQMPPGFMGCTILGNGHVVPLMDANGLFRWLDRHKLPLKVDQIPLFIKEKTTTIMVVDDSINVRRFLALMLEKAGYVVEQAKDGQEALERLDRSNPIKLVICDLEMPRLDGYGFLTQLKSKPRYQEIPVIMLTSRSSEKHRQMAIDLGATDYFTKPFQEDQLLERIKNLVG